MKFSIVTPSLNQGAYIEKTIKSVLEQKGVDLEYIVVDGESTDETIRILKKYRKKLKFISEKDTGQPEATNKGFRMSKGDILAWINSDDEYLPDTLIKVEKYFKDNPKCMMVYGDYWIKNSREEIISKIKEIDFNKNIFLGGVNYIFQPTVFFKRGLWEKLGGFNEKLQYTFDTEWWLKVIKEGYPIGHLRSYLAVARLHAQCKTIKNRAKMLSELDKVFGYPNGRIFFRIKRQILRLLTRGQINLLPRNMGKEWQ